MLCCLTLTHSGNKPSPCVCLKQPSNTALKLCFHSLCQAPFSADICSTGPSKISSPVASPGTICSIPLSCQLQSTLRAHPLTSSTEMSLYSCWNGATPHSRSVFIPACGQAGGGHQPSGSNIRNTRKSTSVPWICVIKPVGVLSTAKTRSCQVADNHHPAHVLELKEQTPPLPLCAC